MEEEHCDCGVEHRPVQHGPVQHGKVRVFDRTLEDVCEMCLKRGSCLLRKEFVGMEQERMRYSPVKVAMVVVECPQFEKRKGEPPTLTLTDGIQVLGQLELEVVSDEDYRKHLAVRLGIDAMKSVREMRRRGEIRLPPLDVEKLE